MRTDLVPLWTTEVSTVAVPVPEQLALETLQTPDTPPLVWLSKPSQNAAVVQFAGGGGGEEDDDADGVGDAGGEEVGGGDCPLAAQLTCGTGLGTDPLARKPKVVLPPPGMVPFQVAFTAVTAVPDWVSTEFQP